MPPPPSWLEECIVYRPFLIGLQARRQGGFEGFDRTTFLKLTKLANCAINGETHALTHSPGFAFALGGWLCQTSLSNPTVQFTSTFRRRARRAVTSRLRAPGIQERGYNCSTWSLSWRVSGRLEITVQASKNTFVCRHLLPVSSSTTPQRS